MDALFSLILQLDFFLYYAANTFLICWLANITNLQTPSSTLILMDLKCFLMKLLTLNQSETFLVDELFKKNDDVVVNGQNLHLINLRHPGGSPNTS